jgi:hypothetical protein
MAFEGNHFSGSGDEEYLRLLDISRRMFEPDPQYQSVPMLYQPKWNGLAEGPTWDAWWIQNSYGTTYTCLPFVGEPIFTWIQNSQDQWFNHEGDGKSKDKNGYVGPDGCLVDCANPDVCYYRQGDGQTGIHDWGMEFTAAGVVMQSELLLIARDPAAIERYLPKLERCANFIETRRDPKTGLYRGGVACNLLAPSFGGYLKPDGTRGLADHAGLQVTYIAALDRLIELETLIGHHATAKVYEKRRDLARQSLPKLITDEGYFINSIDPDGTKHGVFGAPRHGYFESSVNHDAICFGIADQAQAKKIYVKIASIPQLRPHHLIIPNYPGYDDMYAPPQGLWAYGTWVNGGHWSTCEARMIMAYYRVGHPEDARASMKQLMKFADAFKMDNPLVDFGAAPDQPDQPINLTYDAFGIPAAMIRGLFEYQYKADRLVLIPHVPPTIKTLRQHDPIRFGTKKVFIETIGTGPIAGVSINGEPWAHFTPEQITLPADSTPEVARITIRLASALEAEPSPPDAPATDATAMNQVTDPALKQRGQHLLQFIEAMKKAGLGESYEAAHADLAARAIEVIPMRRQMLDSGAIKKLPGASQAAADRSYVETAEKLFDGLKATLATYQALSDPQKQRILNLGQRGEAQPKP